MDYPAAVFPVGRFVAGEYVRSAFSQDFLAKHEPRNPIEEFIGNQWNPETYDNTAVGLQLIGRRLNEERVLGMLRSVEDAINSF
ncbi:hypothetical protein A0H81_01526 [Grifola frondosa]|uniref:Uncharacterized protein n=1 Tax=Grifola frondosa TaxID=5627 RepID=A0A1C7MQV6_GRIFR|nr:hypothetical protein A0H81_01526 [Grifola frondosa]